MMYGQGQSGRQVSALFMGMLAGAAFVMALAWATPVVADTEGASRPSLEAGQGITGDRMLAGTVTKIAGGQIEVDTGEVQPRVLPLKDATDKGFPTLKMGDKLNIMLNEQNLVVDFHLVGQPSSHLRVIGQLALPLAVGHEKAIVRKEDGNEESYAIKPPARSKVAAIPVGARAVFLIDETHQIADAMLEPHPAGLSGKKSPIKSAQQRIEGRIVDTLHANHIRIRTQDGKEHPYDVRPMVQDKLAELKKGQEVILMLADDNTVVDVAIPSGRKGKGKGKG